MTIPLTVLLGPLLECERLKTLFLFFIVLDILIIKTRRDLTKKKR